MWCVRWAGWVALLAGLVLGEPRLSFHPPIYLYEFGDLSDQSVQFATVGHIRHGQQFAKIDLKPFPCVRRVRFVRVVVLNAHNPAHVFVRQNAVYVLYASAEYTRSTYLVWASRSGVQDSTCVHRLRDMMSNHRRRLLQYQLQKPTTIRTRQGYPVKHGHLPGHVKSPHHGSYQEWSGEDSDADDKDNLVEGRNGKGTATNHNGYEAKQEDSLYEDSSETNKEVVDKRNNDVLHEENPKETYEVKHEPIWKLKRQRKNNVNNTIESVSQDNNADSQDLEDPFNITETVKFGLNTTIFRRTLPVRTVNEEIIENYITPEQFMSQSTIPSGISVIPGGFTYQLFNLPSSSEATSAKLPPPPGDLPQDQTEWDAYFKSLVDNNSSMVDTEMPILAATASTNE